MQLPEWKCPDNVTAYTLETGVDPAEERLREVGGALMLASVVQMLISIFGVVGFMMRFIGPLTLTPAVSLVAINLYGVINSMCEKHWGVALFAMVATLISSLYVGNKVMLPIPDWNKREGWVFHRLPVFTVFPVRMIG
ncbi:PREDICTED: solute carrier family 23 member 2-like [Priapulus caudatus]|uniref:Solute carrier family 23 member 2-like n=1 Tax=Priapulus caudatus TaxID=37621 RepID=A0ABM1FB71_PRICU|nr:PREDICTED: solute carrier family 23 member 2-like [Priapulus caudatus]